MNRTDPVGNACAHELTDVFASAPRLRGPLGLDERNGALIVFAIERRVGSKLAVVEHVGHRLSDERAHPGPVGDDEGRVVEHGHHERGEDRVDAVAVAVRREQVEDHFGVVIVAAVVDNASVQTLVGVKIAHTVIIIIISSSSSCVFGGHFLVSLFELFCRW